MPNWITPATDSSRPKAARRRLQRGSREMLEADFQFRQKQPFTFEAKILGTVIQRRKSDFYSGRQVCSVTGHWPGSSNLSLIWSVDMIKHPQVLQGLPEYQYPFNKAKKGQSEAASHFQEDLMTRISSIGPFIEHSLVLWTLGRKAASQSGDNT